MHHKNIDAIIQKAKQQRAEYIGSALHKHPIGPLLLVTIPILLMQFSWSPSGPIASDVQDSQSALDG